LFQMLKKLDHLASFVKVVGAYRVSTNKYTQTEITTKITVNY
jgi:hypothetical protein